MKVAFLDRDGTIIKDYPDQEWKNKITPEFFPKAIATLKHLQKLGYQLIIITNQYLIDEKIITQADYEAFQEKFMQELLINNVKILKVYYAPAARQVNHIMTKPNPGMINQALEDFPEIDLKNSFIVGDSQVDIALAQNVGLPIFAIAQANTYEKCTQINTLSDLISQL
jgi:histidinol-phosphate phosphatase family domain/HAD-superfamily hydrolase, subfamily IIIA